jgi:putative FmdB family regulatory protein
MPNYDYRCLDCNEVFEVCHSINDKWEKCNCCESENIKKLISKVSFTVKNGTPNFGAHGYTGRHQDLVKSLKGNKGYREGFNRERDQDAKQGLQDWKAEQAMKKSQDTFQKMKAEGEKMTKAEKEQIKQEFGIKKGMKIGKL